jgi:hypothetical protein
MKSMFIYVKGNQAAVANKEGQVKRFEAVSERLAGLAAFNYVLSRVPANSTDVYRIVVKNKSFLKQMKWMNRNIPNYIATGQLRSGEKFTAEEIAMFKTIKQSKLAYKGTKVFVITETELKREEKESWKAWHAAIDAIVVKEETKEEPVVKESAPEKSFVNKAQAIMDQIAMLQKQLEELQKEEEKPEVEIADDELENFVFPEDM